jgi:ubiquinone/menaquinone biosynthesis C-methylase UbiE
MTDKNAQFKGSIPELYDRELGPVLFEPYARDLARRVDVATGARVLEVACGTGIVTRRLRERMPKDATLVATDLNEAMLDVARKRLADLDGIEWKVADAQELPFDDGAFACVVCQFGIMFVPDKDRAAREAHRVLAPGGRIVLNSWDAIERNAFMRVAHETITALYPEDPPTFYRVPFGYADPDEIRALLERNGFTDVTVENVKVEARAAAAHAFARGLVEGNPVSLAIEERGGTLPPVVAAIAQKLTAEFGADPIVSTFQAWVATGTR